MRSSAGIRFAVRQMMIVGGAIVVYFGVRGLTEGAPSAAHRNANRVLQFEQTLGIAVEEPMQRTLARSDVALDLANWIYIWGHWPILIGTLVWLFRSHRAGYLELRNAIIISGLIGLFIFATFPVAPPRLYGEQFVDTVTLRSHSYRVLQPPAFINRYAAVPSLHFGWNLLVGIVWFRVGRWRWHRVTAVVMPAAMAWAVVATANHWVFDVLIGGTIAVVGLWLDRMLHRQRMAIVQRRAAPTIELFATARPDALAERGVVEREQTRAVDAEPRRDRTLVS